MNVFILSIVFMLGLATIPTIDEIKYAHNTRKAKKAAAFDALVRERADCIIATRELDAWGIITRPIEDGGLGAKPLDTAHADQLVNDSWGPIR